MAEIAAQQAETAGQRHEEQTKADFRRRITESYSKAVTQLASDKLEERLGGIYTLESISKESPADYWTVMETLTAFVRERSRRNEAERTSQDLEHRVSRRAYSLWQGAGRPEGKAEYFWAEAVNQDEFGEPPATDVATVLTVIKRRSGRNREREGTEARRFDLRGAVLKQADLKEAHLEGADLDEAHLEGADLDEAHLERADLKEAHLEGARLRHAHLEAADLRIAHLQGADLGGAYLEGAQLRGAHLQGARLGLAHLEGGHLVEAHLEGAFLFDAHLEGATLWGAYLEGAQLRGAHLQGADLGRAHLEGAFLFDAHLEGADLSDAEGLSVAQFAHGDAATQLPEGIARPAHWPDAATQETDEDLDAS